MQKFECFGQNIKGGNIMRTSIELLIKPASGNCNMKCTYCFYADTQKNREVAPNFTGRAPGVMFAMTVCLI